MNNRRLLLLAIAIVAVGVFALPGTVSLFSGQHRWYNLSTGTNDVPCEKCHADVAEEMNALAGPHTGETGYERLKCGYCHRLLPCLLYTSPSPRDGLLSRMPSSA